jgi:hypothetical protein
MPVAVAVDLMRQQPALQVLAVSVAAAAERSALVQVASIPDHN